MNLTIECNQNFNTCHDPKIIVQEVLHCNVFSLKHRIIAMVKEHRSFHSMNLLYFVPSPHPFVCLAYQGKDIVFRFVIEYSSLRDFGPG
jgi:hypothetical protein